MEIMNIKLTCEEYQKFNDFIKSCYSSGEWEKLNESEKIAELSNFLEDLNDGICPFCDCGDPTNIIKSCKCRINGE